jgi:hypothetical protein
MKIASRYLLLAMLLGLVGETAEAMAPPGHFTISADGQTVHDAKTNLTWQRTVSPTTLIQPDARTYCQNLGSTLEGTGWRLPTAREIMTLVDFSQPAPPLIDSTVFPALPATSFTSFWSTTIFPPSNDGFYVEFSSGMVNRTGLPSPLYVRCVR